MSADWVKMRTDLYRDPKICMMAELLSQPESELGRYVDQNTQRNINVTRNVMRNAVVGALVTVWGVFRHRGKRYGDDLVIENCPINVIDDVADLPGFGKAMVLVGWLVKEGYDLVFPRFFEDFNVSPNDDHAAKNAERQRRYREKKKLERNENSNVTVTSQNNIEKSREEKSNNKKNNTKKSSQPETLASRETKKPLVLDFSVWPEFPSEQVWTDYKKLRAAKKAPITQTVVNTMATEIKKLPHLTVDQILTECINRGWQGLKSEWFDNTGGHHANGQPRYRESIAERSWRQSAEILAEIEAEEAGGCVVAENASAVRTQVG